MIDGGPTPELRRLVERFHDREPVALARAISMVEGERPGFEEMLHELLKPGPATARVGVTGPPGAGKSSLVAAATARYRARGETVGMVAVDPTSPYSGGALLGDRIRMNELATDPGVFIRSMASRGSLGGLATTTREVLDLLDAFRFDRILVETVGVGQTELEIASAADTVVVVLVPESGDAIQAMKAGLMEIADLFVVNKADRPGADRLVKEIRQALHLKDRAAPKDLPILRGQDSWTVPVVATTVPSGQGVDELLGTIEEHRAWLERSGQLDARRRARTRDRVRSVVGRKLERVVWSRPETTALLDAGVERIRTSEATAYSVARRIVEEILG